MSKALSVDLRERVVAAIEAGSSCRAAASRFGVGISSAIRWASLKRAVGSAAPGPLGGDRRSGRVESHAPLILGLLEQAPDITLSELRAELAEAGVPVGIATLWRLFPRRRITLKKSRRSRQNSSALTSWRGAGNGSRGSSISTRTAWRSSTRPGPRPTWPAPAAGHRAASACALPSRTATGRRRPSSPTCTIPAWPRGWCLMDRSMA